MYGFFNKAKTALIGGFLNIRHCDLSLSKAAAATTCKQAEKH